MWWECWHRAWWHGWSFGRMTPMKNSFGLVNGFLMTCQTRWKGVRPFSEAVNIGKSTFFSVNIQVFLASPDFHETASQPDSSWRFGVLVLLIWWISPRCWLYWWAPHPWFQETHKLRWICCRERDFWGSCCKWGPTCSTYVSLIIASNKLDWKCWECFGESIPIIHLFRAWNTPLVN